MFGATENKHWVIDSAVCQVIQTYSIRPSFLPGKLPNCGNSLKLLLRVEDSSEKALCFKTTH